MKRQIIFYEGKVILESDKGILPTSVPEGSYKRAMYAGDIVFWYENHGGRWYGVEAVDLPAEIRTWILLTS